MIDEEKVSEKVIVDVKENNIQDVAEILGSVEEAEKELVKLVDQSESELRDNKKNFQYGVYPPENRYAVDQVPLTFEKSSQTYNPVGARDCYVAAPKHDMTKRQTSLQLTIRASGDQIIKPAIIFRGKPKKIKGKIDSRIPANNRLLGNYDKRVTVYYQKKAWADEHVVRAWQEDFEAVTVPVAGGKPRAVTLDNLSSQLGPNISKLAKRVGGTKFVWTPENCTDLCAVVDCGVGAYIKINMAKSFLADFESSEQRTDAWSDGKVSIRERRELYCKWLGDAWEDIQKTRIIYAAFKKCGFNNDMKGLENHLVNVRNLLTYKVPGKNDKPMEPLSKKEIIERQEAEEVARKNELLLRRSKRAKAKRKRKTKT